MSGRAALDLSLVEWRALAGVCLCLEVYEGGLWADEARVLAVTGEREDRLLGRRAGSGEWVRGQLDSLEAKGLVKRHGVEPRVRLLQRVNAAGAAQGALGFGLDLETALAQVDGERTSLSLTPNPSPRGRGEPAAAAAGGDDGIVVGECVADVAARPGSVGGAVAADVAGTSFGDWRERYRELMGREAPRDPPGAAAAAGTFKRTDVFVQEDVTTFKRGPAAATATEVPRMRVLADSCSVEVLAAAVREWVEPEEWCEYWDPALGKADYGSVNLVRAWNWLARHPGIKPKKTRGKMLFGYLQHPEWTR